MVILCLKYGNTVSIYGNTLSKYGSSGFVIMVSHYCLSLVFKIIDMDVDAMGPFHDTMFGIFTKNPSSYGRVEYGKNESK